MNSAWRPLIDGSFMTASQSAAVPDDGAPLELEQLAGLRPVERHQPADPRALHGAAAAAHVDGHRPHLAAAATAAPAPRAATGAPGASDQPQYGHWSQLACSFSPQEGHFFFFEKSPIFAFFCPFACAGAALAFLARSLALPAACLYWSPTFLSRLMSPLMPPLTLIDAEHLRPHEARTAP